MNLIKFAIIGVAATATALASCTSGKQADETVSGLNPARFDSIVNNKKVALYTLKNNNGMEVCITNFGGRVVSLVDRFCKQPKRLWFFCRTLCQPHWWRQAYSSRQEISVATEQLWTLSSWWTFGLDISSIRCRAT